MKKRSAMMRLLDNVWQRDRGLFGNCVLYTFVALGMSLVSVAFPRVMLGLVTGAAPSDEALIKVCVGFLIVGGVFYFFESWITNRCYPRITALRIDYLRDQVVKCMEMEYRYAEDAAFEEKYSMGMNACNGNNQGLEAIYHKGHVS